MTVPARFSTLIDLVRTRASASPERLAYAFLLDGEVEGPRLTYAELDSWARTIAVALRESGAEGGRALLLYPPGLEFIAAFLGCLYANVIAVPAYPPDPARLTRSLPRLQAIAKDARPVVVLTAAASIAGVRAACIDLPELAGARYIATDALETSLAPSYRERRVTGADVAFLQYTSGSTSQPRGVMVAHRNILANTESMRIAFDLSERDISVTWLPNFHDLGLIEGILMPLYTGHPCYILAPAAFVKRPARWLEAVTRYRATHTGCPNFGYELCVRKVTADEKSRLDLSSLRSAYNGAEPIHVDTPSRFYEAFAEVGLRRDVMFLCYGLAEATLMVSGGPVGSAPVIAEMDGAALEQHRLEPPVDGAGVRRLIGSGRLLQGNTVVVVDPETRERLPPETVGELWVFGDLVAQGYWERPDDTRVTFNAVTKDGEGGRFLRTGDLGFMRGDQLFCTGRIKDLIILDGTNHYPQDIEAVVERSHPAVRQGCSAAFAVLDGEDERLIVVAEIDRARAEALAGADAEAIFGAIRGALSEREDIEADAIVLLAPGTVFKTSSGKIQRGACRAAYIKGELTEVARWQRPRAVSSSGQVALDRESAEDASTSADEAEIRAFLMERVAALSGVPLRDVDRSATFARHGLSSRSSVALVGEIEARFGLRLSPTILWEKQSIDLLSRHLASSGAAEGPRRVIKPTGPSPDEVSEIAIVGIGCRFPRARGPASFYELLREGVDAIELVPPDRWDIGAFYDPDIGRAGKMNTRWGGFLEGVDRFDARFFGIANREAERMDPQQRLALEVAWEALEDAGIPAARAQGTKTAVFMGASMFEYGAEQLSRFRELDGYAGTGSALNIIANRISYFLDLHGPSVVVDTACSSSLVAVHLACQSLRAGESEMAIAGGVNLILSPSSTINASRLGNLASDGRCKTFDARADGAVRSEGVGVVVLKPLRRAVADGDRIYAVIRGTAVNQDGRSNGLMAPNPDAQVEVLREAYRRAGVSPAAVHYVEAHGTGTLLGDPIEAKALGAVIGEGRPLERPCLIGSVKTNIGHTEAAAGVAGLIKMALSLHCGEIPKSLHFDRPNPHIPFSSLGLRVADRIEPWPDGPRYGGVSAFGWGGTNAHVVLEGRDASARAPGSEGAATSDRATLLVVSAKTQEALRALAAKHRDTLAEPKDAASLDDRARAAALRRSHHERRLAVVGRTRVEIRESLDAFLKGEARPQMSADESSGERRKIAFVCPGNGSQRVGMGRGLLATEPVFRDYVRRCDAIVRPIAAGFSILAALEGDDEAWLARNDLVQPALVALELALASLFASWGVEPEGVVGHSLGELPAAHLAGALTLEDTLRVTCLRSSLLLRLRGHGGMAMTELSVDEARELIGAWGGRLTIGASNGPKSTVLSGEIAALDEALARLEGRGIFARKIKADGAGHSPFVDPLCPELLHIITGLRPSPTVLKFYSTVTGGLAPELPLDAAYWARNMRETVLFSSAVERMIADGYNTFIELSAHPILLSSVSSVAARASRPAIQVLPSLKRGEDERASMLGSLGALYTVGHPVALERVYAEGSAMVTLPTYPFQSERFWLDAEGTAFTQGKRGASSSAPRGADAHPLLGDRMSSAAHVGVDFFKVSFSVAAMPEIGDHRLRGAALVPAAVYMSLVRAAASAVQFGAEAALTSVSFGGALGVPDVGEVDAQLILEQSRPGELLFRVFSGAGGSEDGWSLHCSGTISRAEPERGAGGPLKGATIEEILARCGDVTRGPDVYERFAARGMEYGPRFQQIQWAARGEREAIVRLSAREPGAARGEGGPMETSIDAAMQALALALSENGDDAYLPVAAERVLWGAARADAAYGYAALRDADDKGGRFVGDVALLTEEGDVVWSASGLQVFRAAARAGRGSAAVDGLFYELALRQAQPPQREHEEAVDSWVIFSDQRGVGGQVLRSLEAAGQRVIHVAYGGNKFEKFSDKSYRICLDDANDLRALFADIVANQSGDASGRTRVVHLLGLDAEARATEGAPPPRSVEALSCVSALHLVQAVAAQGFRDPPRVYFITRGARPAEGPVTSPALAPLWAIAKVAAYEHPELHVGCIDIDPARDDVDIRGLVDELCSNDRERGVALRRGGRYVERLAPLSPREIALPSSAPPPTARERAGRSRAAEFRLRIDQPGTLGGLALREAPRPAPKAGQVVIDVRAAGLNFRDVLKALGVDLGLPPGEEILFGDECSGVIAAVGPGVLGLRVGDEVIAVAPGSHGSSVVAEARLVMRKPAGFSFEEAATIPIAHLTALYSLSRVGRLSPGESVLIHAAAGGVGLAAVRIARRLGARVFATVGTPEKAASLRAMGVEHVMSSRTLAFVEEIKELTGGAGVDMVINSLAGDFIPASLSVLAPGGRFLEVGRRDIAKNSPLGMKWLQRNVAVIGVDLFEVLFGASTAVGDRLVQDLALDVERGAIEPLPHTDFSMGAAEDAFRYMAEAKHIGKVILSLPQEVRAEVAPERAAGAVDPEGTYLIAGGLGGLGVVIARWLVLRGARSLVLVGRSGPSDAALAAITDLKQLGDVDVFIERADMSSAEASRRVIEGIQARGRALRGIVHAAVDMADATVLRATAEHVRRVMASKVDIAWNLHVATRSAPLDMFLLISSAASMLGSPGQAVYAAANAFLDALAHARRADGLCATSVGFGTWSEVGGATGADKAGRLALRGLDGLTTEQGLLALSRAVESGRAHTGVMRLDIRRWKQSYPQIAEWPLLSEVEKSPVDSAPAESAVRRSILEAPTAAARRGLLGAHLRQEIGRVLRIPPDSIGDRTAFGTLGFDSLMALEIRNRLEASLGLRLIATMVWAYPSIDALMEHVSQKLGVSIEREPDPPVADAPPEASLSEEEADALMAEKLAALEKRLWK